MPATTAVQASNSTQAFTSLAKNTLLPPFYAGISMALKTAAKNLYESVPAWNEIGPSLTNCTVQAMESFPCMESFSSLKTTVQTFSTSSLCLTMAAWGFTAHVLHIILLRQKLTPELQPHSAVCLSWGIATAMILPTAAHLSGSDWVDITQLALLTLASGLVFTKAVLPVTQKSLHGISVVAQKSFYGISVVAQKSFYGISVVAQKGLQGISWLTKNSLSATSNALNALKWDTKAVTLIPSVKKSNFQQF